MKKFFATALLAIIVTSAFGMNPDWSKYFFGKVDLFVPHNNTLYVGTETGIVALDSSGKIIFENRDLMGVEQIKFLDIDNDGKDEILISNWMEFAILDDNGSQITRQNVVDSIATNPLACDWYKDANGVTIVAATQSNTPTIFGYSYTNTPYYPVNLKWAVLADPYANLIKDRLRIVDNNLLVMNSVGQSETNTTNSLYKQNLINGGKEATITIPALMETMDISSQYDLIVIGSTHSMYESPYTVTKQLHLYRLSNFSAMMTPLDFDLYIRKISIVDNNILVVTNDKMYLGDSVHNKTYLFTYNNNALTQQFVYDSGAKEVTSSSLYKENGIFKLLLGFKDGTSSKLDANGQITNTYDLSQGLGLYAQPISALSFDGNKTIVGGIDIALLGENNTTSPFYHNGNLVASVLKVNVDDDANNEFIVNDGRVYLYDDNGSLLWTHHGRINQMAVGDVNGDGKDEVVITDQMGLHVLDKNHTSLLDINQTEIIKLALKDINGDGKAELICVIYGNNGDSIKIFDYNKTVLNEILLGDYATNSGFLEVITSSHVGGHSILANLSNLWRIDLDGNKVALEYNNWANDAYKTVLLDDYNKDGRVEIVRTFHNGITNKYGIKFIDTEIIDLDTYQGKILKAFDVTDKEIRGIALFDYNDDGINEILISDGDALYLYKNDGTQIWKFNQALNTTSTSFEENHFTNIEVAYQSDKNHKIFVSGYTFYQFDKNGNFVDKAKPSKGYMVTSSGSYANPFAIGDDGKILLGQMGIFKMNAALTLLPHSTFLYLQEGWNLISLPVDIILTNSQLLGYFPHASQVWKYDNASWQYYSNNPQNRSLAQSTGYQLLTSINAGDGFWIYNTTTEDRSFEGASYAITQKVKFQNISLPWTLLGAGQNTSLYDIINSNEAIELIWSYNDRWQAFSTNHSIYQLLESYQVPIIDTISSGRGFWVYKP